MQFWRQICETVPYTDGTAAGLQTSSEEAGIDCSVILPVATKPEQFDSINRFAMQFRGQDRLLSFGGIHPDTENVREKLMFLKDLDLKALNYIPIISKHLSMISDVSELLMWRVNWD